MLQGAGVCQIPNAPRPTPASDGWCLSGLTGTVLTSAAVCMPSSVAFEEHLAHSLLSPAPSHFGVGDP